jgi:hypothetical protein
MRFYFLLGFLLLVDYYLRMEVHTHMLTITGHSNIMYSSTYFMKLQVVHRLAW